MKYEFTIHGYIPRAPNARARMHWSRRMDERNFWEACCALAAYTDDIPKATDNDLVRKVSYTIHKPGKVRLRDEDNLVASVKHLQDALVNIGLLVDDDKRWLEWGGVTERNGMKRYATVVTLEDWYD